MYLRLHCCRSISQASGEPFQGADSALLELRNFSHSLPYLHRFHSFFFSFSSPQTLIMSVLSPSCLRLTSTTSPLTRSASWSWCLSLSRLFPPFLNVLYSTSCEYFLPQRSWNLALISETVLSFSSKFPENTKSFSFLFLISDSSLFPQMLEDIKTSSVCHTRQFFPVCGVFLLGGCGTSSVEVMYLFDFSLWKISNI